jgi:hypothetical protein
MERQVGQVRRAGCEVIVGELVMRDGGDGEVGMCEGAEAMSGCKRERVRTGEDLRCIFRRGWVGRL